MYSVYSCIHSHLNVYSLCIELNSHTLTRILIHLTVNCVGVDIHCSIATELKEATAVHTCGPGERAILAIWRVRAVSIASAVA